MLQIKKLKSLNIVRISFVVSIIVYQEVGCKYFNISCRLENIKKKFLIDAQHYYWTQNLLISSQMAEFTELPAGCYLLKLGSHHQPNMLLYMSEI